MPPSNNRTPRALLLDRDGTIIEDPKRDMRTDRLQFLPGTIEGLQRFIHARWLLFCITNQAGIGTGLYSEAAFFAHQSAMERMLKNHGIPLSGTYFCPHAPDDACNCRKPKTGLWDALHRDHPDLSPSACLMAGDKDSDIAFGQAIGATTIRISSPHSTSITAEYTAPDLLAVSHIVLP